MKITANERLGILLVVAILALAALCITLHGRGPSAKPVATPPDTVIIAQPAPDSVSSVVSPKRHTRTHAAPPPSRSPLDETF